MTTVHRARKAMKQAVRAAGDAHHALHVARCQLHEGTLNEKLFRLQRIYNSTAHVEAVASDYLQMEIRV